MKPQRTCIIRNGKIVTRERILDGDLVFSDGVLTQVGGSADEPTGAEVVDARGRYVLPGFVNLHVHGGVGFDLTAGAFDSERKTFDPDLARYPEMLGRLASSFARHGVTYALLATVASSEERLKAVGGELSRYVRGDRNGADGARIGGAFLEGTFIKNPDFSGAQNPAHFREADVETFDRLNDETGGLIRYALVAPEWGERAVELIEALTERGVLTGAGHTACTADEYRAAVAAGMRMAVHLTNGPTGASTKPFNGGGALEAALTCDEVYAEIIMDGYHVYVGYVLDIIARKGLDRVCVITDAMFATEAEGVRDFEVEGIAGELNDTGEYLRVLAKEGTLFGSVLRMDRAVRNALDWLTAGLPGVWRERHEPLAVEDALRAVTRLVSENPARALGLFEPDASRSMEECVGSLEPGKRADVVVMRVDGEPGGLAVDVEDVFIGGRRPTA